MATAKGEKDKFNPRIVLSHIISRLCKFRLRFLSKKCMNHVCNVFALTCNLLSED